MRVDAALRCVRRLGRPLEPERVGLAQALGRVLRAPVVAREDQPPFDRSAVDGFAFRRDDRSRRFRIVDEIRAGDWKPRRLRRGEAVRVATGGALPGTGLRVVKQEDVQADDAGICVLRRERTPQVRRRGEDARRGQVLVETGTRLQSGTLALLASVGHTEPRVTRLPRVLHVATGDEIVAPDAPRGRGQVRDANSTLVRGFLALWGIQPEWMRLPDDEDQARAALAGARTTSVDLLLVSGGASVGERDGTRRLLEHLGYRLHIRGTASRPGKPLLVARRGRALAFGLPGNPLAHFVCLHLYVRAALARWAGRPAEPRFEWGFLAADLDGGRDPREILWPACWHRDAGGWGLRPLRWRSSGDLTALATANALLRIPPGTGQVQRGCPVRFTALPCLP